MNKTKYESFESWCKIIWKATRVGVNADATAWDTANEHKVTHQLMTGALMAANGICGVEPEGGVFYPDNTAEGYDFWDNIGIF